MRLPKDLLYHSALHRLLFWSYKFNPCKIALNVVSSFLPYIKWSDTAICHLYPSCILQKGLEGTQHDKSSLDLLKSMLWQDLKNKV